MVVLKAAIGLFERWNNNGLRYCHWKSNEHLVEGLAGLTDLDVLCDSKQAALCTQLLDDTGYIRLESQFGSRYLGVEDWVACDNETGMLIHIHLHYQMITGHQGMKEYVLPWTDLALNSRVMAEDYPVYITDPTLEFIILHSRIGLKATTKSLNAAKKNKFIISDDDKREIDYLRQKIDTKKINGLLNAYFPNTNESMRVVMMSNYQDSQWYLELYKICRTDLGKYSRIKQPKKIFVSMLYYFIIRFRFFVNHWFREFFLLKKNLGKEKGIIVAFLGQDGAGKSTVSSEVKKWLEWKLDVRKYYLGSGDHYHSIQKDIGYRLRGGKFDSVGRILLISDLIHLSKHVRKIANRAKKYSKEGGIVLFDRYPQLLCYGINDGPKIRCSLNNKNLIPLLERILCHYASLEELNYHKTLEVQPDLVFKLMLSPEMSIVRKPEESLESVTKKHYIIKEMNFEKATMIEIDATMDYSEEIKIIHNAIWNQIVKKRKVDVVLHQNCKRGRK